MTSGIVNVPLPGVQADARLSAILTMFSRNEAYAIGAALILIILLLLTIILLLLRRRGIPPSSETETPTHAIPSQIAGPAVAQFLKARMTGTPSDGSAFTGSPPAKVVWVDAGDEVLVHLDSLKTQVSGQSVVVSLDLETDQTGRTPIVVVFALGADDQAGLVAATDEYPRGDGALVARWGGAVQAAAWSALLSLATDHAGERGLVPRGLAIAGGQLSVTSGQAPKVT